MLELHWLAQTIVVAVVILVALPPLVMAGADGYRRGIVARAEAVRVAELAKADAYRVAVLARAEADAILVRASRPERRSTRRDDRD